MEHHFHPRYGAPVFVCPHCLCVINEQDPDQPRCECSDGEPPKHVTLWLAIATVILIGGAMLAASALAGS